MKESLLDPSASTRAGTTTTSSRPGTRAVPWSASASAASLDQMRPLLTYHMVRASHEAQIEAKPENEALRPHAGRLRGHTSAMPRPGPATTTPPGPPSSTTSPWASASPSPAMPNFGHDAGGFSGFRISKELFRALGAVRGPSIRASAYIPGISTSSVNEPWMYPDVQSPAVKAAFELRYQAPALSVFALRPERQRRGEPILRPLVYEFPEDGEVCGGLLRLHARPLPPRRPPVYKPRGAGGAAVSLPAGT